MRVPRMLCVCIAICLLTPLLGGCGGGDGSSGGQNKPDTRSPLEYFKATQGPTMTTHGKIKMDTVQEVGDNIQYQTDDNKTWSVKVTKLADGTYKCVNLEEVK